MMGVETSLPLLRWIPPTRRAPCGGLNYRISWKPYLPRRAPRGALRRGDIIKISLIFNNFHISGVNSSFICVSREHFFHDSFWNGNHHPVYLLQCLSHSVGNWIHTPQQEQDYSHNLNYFLLADFRQLPVEEKLDNNT